MKANSITSEKKSRSCIYIYIYIGRLNIPKHSTKLKATETNICCNLKMNKLKN